MALQLAYLLLFPVISLSAPNPIRIEYVVDTRQSGKKILFVNARIHSLPKGEISFQFSAPRERPLEIGKRIKGLSGRTAQGETRRIEIKNDQFTFENNSQEAIDVSYSLTSDSFLNLIKGTYFDEARCLFHSQDALFTLESHNVASEISFILPASWKIITLANRVGEESYQVMGRKDTVFYLGEAAEISARMNNSPSSFAIEASWPIATEDTLQELKRQLNYLRKSLGDWQAQPLLVIFISSPNDSNEVLSFGEGEMIVLIAPRSFSAESEVLKGIRHHLAQKLVGYCLPALYTSDESDIKKTLIEYLAWKTCLKTGYITRGEFLEKMAQGFWEDAHKGRINPVGLSLQMKKVYSRDSFWKGGSMLSFFLIDLALNFYGRDSNSLNFFLQKSFRRSEDTKLASEDFLKRLQAEREVSKTVELLLNSSELSAVPELLKPYGLIFVRTELPSFGFDLSESFQITQFTGGTGTNKSRLRQGDRIVAINETRLIRPTDLFKLRSALRPGQEVTLTVQRNGSTFRSKHFLEKEISARLEAYKFADADKHERLEKFLTKDILS